MRIRKQAKLAGVPISNGISSGDQIKLHCHLSQSPWDVISFPPPFSFSSPQIGGDFSFTPGGGSSGNSPAAVESVDSMKIIHDIDLLLESDDSGGDNASLCGMTDGKSWKCMNEVAEGQSVCQYHLHQRSVATADAAAVATGRPKKKRATQRVAPPDEPVYYFYTEFGPWWTKQRGGAKGKNRNKPVGDMEVDGEEKQCDYGNDYDSDGDGIGEVGRVKRARKPIKARSLKSLM